jgi:DnaK suppressor protein
MPSTKKKKVPAKATKKIVKAKAKPRPAPKASAKAKPSPKSAVPAKAKLSPKSAAPAKAKLPLGTRPRPLAAPTPSVPRRQAAPKPVRHVESPIPKAEQRDVREKLVTLLEQLQDNIQQEVKGASERDLAHITDTSDMASDSAEGELAFRIAESEGVNATEVQKAIEKIDNGDYGICERCSKSIGAERMRFLPFATQCIKCQELAEIRRKEEEEDELGDLAEASEETHEEA